MARAYRQAAVIPYRVHDARVEIALVTTFDGRRWVVPKGSIDEGERARDAAIRETEEEAGLLGELRPRSMGQYRYSKQNEKFLVDVYAMRVTAGSLEFAEDAAVPFDACLLVTGAAAPRWPAKSGLATDESGFICVGPALQSISHPGIFAAGDVAAYHDGRPKSGVFAVRAGPVLADNLRAACNGTPLRLWTPQQRALYLISTGGRHALAVWGTWSFGGRWVWLWKNLIDRRFVRRFSA